MCYSPWIQDTVTIYWGYNTIYSVEKEAYSCFSIAIKERLDIQEALTVNLAYTNFMGKNLLDIILTEAALHLKLGICK